jgi:hypothetical protein
MENTIGSSPSVPSATEYTAAAGNVARRAIGKMDILSMGMVHLVHLVGDSTRQLYPPFSRFVNWKRPTTDF